MVKIIITKKGRAMLSLKCAVRDSKRLRFIKEQEGKGLICMICTILLIGSLLT